MTPSKRRELEAQAAWHGGGDPDHDQARCPRCSPELVARLERRERVAPARAHPFTLPELPRAGGVGGDHPEGLGEIRPVLAALELPQVQVLGDRVTVLGVELGTDQARALWAQLRTVLGEAQRHRRPKAWADLQAWLDRAFGPGIPVRYREATTKARGEGLAVLDGAARALVRVGIFQVAHLKRRRSGGFTGPIADYFPGAMGTGPACPDAMLAFTGRRVLVKGDALEGAAQVA